MPRRLLPPTAEISPFLPNALFPTVAAYLPAYALVAQFGNVSRTARIFAEAALESRQTVFVFLWPMTQFPVWLYRVYELEEDLMHDAYDDSVRDNGWWAERREAYIELYSLVALLNTKFKDERAEEDTQSQIIRRSKTILSTFVVAPREHDELVKESERVGRDFSFFLNRYSFEPQACFNPRMRRYRRVAEVCGAEAPLFAHDAASLRAAIHSSRAYGTIVFEGDAQLAGDEDYTFIEKPLHIEGVPGAATLHGISLGLMSRVHFRDIRFEDASRVVVVNSGYLVLVDCEFCSTNDNTYAVVHVGDRSTLEMRHCAMHDLHGTAVCAECGSTTMLIDSTFASPVRGSEQRYAVSCSVDDRLGSSVTFRDSRDFPLCDY